MTAAEYHQDVFETQFRPYCEKWVKLLNLTGWHIGYEMAEVVQGDGTVEAQVNVNTQLGHRATVTFASRMGFEAGQVREDVVVHEHLHIIMDELAQFVYQYLPKEHHDYFTRLVEIAVSDLSRALVGIGEGK